MLVLQPSAESETEDVLHQLMAESMSEIDSSHAENGSNAVHALHSSQQIDVQSLFMDSGAHVQNATIDAGRDRAEPHSGQANAGVFSRSSCGFAVPASAPGDIMQPAHPYRDVSLVHAGGIQTQDAVDATSAAAPLNGASVSDSVHQHQVSTELGGDGSSIWGSGALGSGRLAQDAPVSEVDWKMMREIWNRPAVSAEGVQQQMQGMQLADSCIGSGQQTANRFGNVAQSQQHATGPAANGIAGGSTGVEGGGEANAMKVLMQLWNSNSEPSVSSQAPVQGKSTADILNAQEDLSQQLLAFHQQHQQKQQAQRQAAANGAAAGMSRDQMLEQLYQQRVAAPAPAARDETHEPTPSDHYEQAIARGHGGSQHAANHAYTRQIGKPVQQVRADELCVSMSLLRSCMHHT